MPKTSTVRHSDWAVSFVRVPGRSSFYSYDLNLALRDEDEMRTVRDGIACLSARERLRVIESRKAVSILSRPNPS